MSSVGKSLKNYWISIGAKVRSGASQDAIQSFETAHGVRSSRDLCDYYQAVDGMEEGQTDNNHMLEFLPLNSLKRVTEAVALMDGWPDNSSVCHQKKMKKHFDLVYIALWMGVNIGSVSI